ncbi:hypothetical protein PRIPAC_96503 [Pristionchus pacificus]|uniref:G protein-coupled receptor n=1 Tax=Pristionchus pacificus TaxID=54126 RepID=A0A2A6BIP6_PRIPA|nr:hypothetical protein PRIPAC_96503 [Pristionchus pacificus]|eukprot:PDM65772.1 G protein-coupled receptor [Pristionchus pacificus]
MVGSYSVGFGVTQASHIIAREIAPTPCVAQIPKSLCIFRMGAAAVTPAFVLIHASLTVHQALATCGCSPLVQRAQAIVAMLLTLGYVVLFGIFSFYEETLTGKVQLCPFFNEKGEVFIIVNLNAMMALDIVNFVTAQLLLKHNKKILAKERNDYELKRTFRRVQNLKAMEQFIPMHALHSISHLAHFGLYSFFYYCRPSYSEAEFIITFAVANVDSDAKMTLISKTFELLGTNSVFKGYKQHSVTVHIHIMSAISASLNITSLLLLILKTPLHVQIILTMIDLNMEVLFHPVPIFPAMAGYGLGLLIMAGVSMIVEVDARNISRIRGRGPYIAMELSETVHNVLLGAPTGITFVILFAIAVFIHMFYALSKQVSKRSRLTVRATRQSLVVLTIQAVNPSGVELRTVQSLVSWMRSIVFILGVATIGAHAPQPLHYHGTAKILPPDTVSSTNYDHRCEEGFTYYHGLCIYQSSQRFIYKDAAAICSIMGLYDIDFWRPMESNNWFWLNAYCPAEGQPFAWKDNTPTDYYGPNNELRYCFMDHGVAMMSYGISATSMSFDGNVLCFYNASDAPPQATSSAPTEGFTNYRGLCVYQSSHSFIYQDATDDIDFWHRLAEDKLFWLDAYCPTEGQPYAWMDKTPTNFYGQHSELANCRMDWGIQMWGFGLAAVPKSFQASALCYYDPSDPPTTKRHLLHLLTTPPTAATTTTAAATPLSHATPAPSRAITAHPGSTKSAENEDTTAKSATSQRIFTPIVALLLCFTL